MVIREGLCIDLSIGRECAVNMLRPEVQFRVVCLCIACFDLAGDRCIRNGILGDSDMVKSMCIGSGVVVAVVLVVGISGCRFVAIRVVDRRYDH